MGCFDLNRVVTCRREVPRDVLSGVNPAHDKIASMWLTLLFSLWGGIDPLFSWSRLFLLLFLLFLLGCCCRGRRGYSFHSGFGEFFQSFGFLLGYQVLSQ